MDDSQFVPNECQLIYDSLRFCRISRNDRTGNNYLVNDLANFFSPLES